MRTSCDTQSSCAASMSVLAMPWRTPSTTAADLIVDRQIPGRELREVGAPLRVHANQTLGVAVDARCRRERIAGLLAALRAKPLVDERRDGGPAVGCDVEPIERR